MVFEWSDLLSILILIVLEGLLSGDNALVLAVLVMPLPEEERPRALRYGLMGAFVLRVIAILTVVKLVEFTWVALVGGGYLLFLVYKHFANRAHGPEDPAKPIRPQVGWFGLSLFWTTVLRAELTDFVFAVDSILAAVGVTRGNPDKTWVLITGGLLGIIMMRLLTMRVLSLIQTYPRLIDAAYVVIAWVGFELVVKYLHEVHVIGWHIPEHIGIGVVLLLFFLGFLYARGHRGDPTVVIRDLDVGQGGTPERQPAPADDDTLPPPGRPPGPVAGPEAAGRREEAPAGESI